MATPSFDQLCTLCNKAKADLDMYFQRLAHLRAEAASTESQILAAQGVVAGLQVAIGEQYQQDTIPMKLEITD